MLLHLGSQINVVFASVDEMGNAVNKMPMTYTVETLDEAGFARAFRSIQHDRAVLAMNLPPPASAAAADDLMPPIEDTAVIQGEDA